MLEGPLNHNHGVLQEEEDHPLVAEETVPEEDQGEEEQAEVEVEEIQQWAIPHPIQTAMVVHQTIATVLLVESHRAIWKIQMRL